MSMANGFNIHVWYFIGPLPHPPAGAMIMHSKILPQNATIVARHHSQLFVIHCPKGQPAVAIEPARQWASAGAQVLSLAQIPGA